MSFDLGMAYLAEIPTEILRRVSDKTMLAIGKKLDSDRHYSSAASKIQAYAKAINGDQLYALTGNSMEELALILFPQCAAADQLQFLGVALDLKPKWLRDNHYRLKTLSINWEEVSRQNPARAYSAEYEKFPMDVLASLVNGQSSNPKFLREFFISFFAPNYREREQKECASLLNPEVFTFENPQDIGKAVWKQFFKLLPDMIDMKRARDLLIKSTCLLFNHPEFGLGNIFTFYALKKEQMVLLPLDKYNPDIRLLLACLTNRLDDQMIATANAVFDDKDTRERFVHLFEPSYSENDKTKVAITQDIKFLKYFLKWVLNRPSVNSLLSTWLGIQQHGDVFLEHKKIKKDEEIQLHLGKLGLLR